MAGSRAVVLLLLGLGLALGALLLIPSQAEAQCVNPVPANDCFANAVVVSATPFTDTKVTSTATMEPGEPSPCCSNGKSVWYSWTPAFSGNGIVTTCPPPATNYDTVLGVYAGTSLATLAFVTSNDQYCGSASQVQFPCTPGTTYMIQVTAWLNGAGGNLAVGVSGCDGQPPPPCTSGPPANDCFTASIATAANTYSNTQSTVGATMETTEPIPCCSIGKSVWYSWTPTVSGFATVDTCGVTGVDTVLAAYTGTAINGLSLITFNDQACGSQSSISFPCSAGTTYQLQISSWLNTQGGNVQLNAVCAPPCTVPANDCFANAIVTSSNSYTNAQSTTGAQVETGEPTPTCCFSISKSVWYSWTPTTSGTAVVETCGSSYNTVLGVYTGNAVNALSQVASNDNFCSTQSRVSFACTAGTTYRVQVASSGTGLAGNLALSLFCGAAPPAGCGYTITTAGVYNFTDISTTGGNPLMHGDFTTIAVTPSPPFTFNLCGTSYNTFWTGSKGLVCLDNSNAATYSTFPAPSGCTSTLIPAIPNPNSPNAAVYGFVADIFPGACPTTTAGSPPSTGRVCTWYQVQGTSPNRVFIYMQKQTPFWSCCYPGPLTYEFKFFEATECIEVHYQSVNPGFRTVRAGYEKAGGTAGWGYPTPSGTGVFPLNQAHANAAWRACPTPPAANDAYSVLEECAALSCESPALPGSLAPNQLNVLGNDPAGTVLSVSSGTCSLQPTCATPKGTASVSPGGGSVTYVPDLDATGVDSFTYRHSNGGTATVTLTIGQVNDAPTFAAGPAVEAAQGAPVQLFPGWATDVAAAQGIVATPPRALDEVPQSVTFTRTSADSPLFAVQPTLDRTATAASTLPSPGAGLFGVLAFTPATSTYGTTNVCFRPQDNGGNVPPNIDVGAERCFDVTVSPCGPTDDAYIAYRWWTLSAPNGNLAGVLANDAGSPVFPLALVQTTAHGALSFNATIGSFTYHPDDNYVGLDEFRYTITCGNSVSRPIRVTIDVRVNQDPVAYFEPASATATPGQGVTFNPCPDASGACSYDPDGTIVSYLWEFGDGYTSSAESPMHVFALPGLYQVRLTVRDNVGNSSVYMHTLTVGWPGQAPVEAETGGGVASLLAFAGENRTVFEGDIVQLSGSQRGGDDSTRFDWSLVRGVPVDLRNKSTPYPEFTAPALANGDPIELVFGLRATYRDTASPLAYVTIDVVSKNHAPLVNAGGLYNARPGVRVDLDGTATRDPDSDELTWLWEQVQDGGPQVTLHNATRPVAWFEAPPGTETLRFRLRAFDGKASGQDFALVALQLPAAKASPTFTFTLAGTGDGAEATFRAVGAMDVTWDFGDGSAPGAGAVVVHRFAPGTYTVTMTGSEGSQAQQVAISETAQAKGTAVTAQGPPWAALGLGLAMVAAVLAGVGILAVRSLRRKV